MGSPSDVLPDLTGFAALNGSKGETNVCVTFILTSHKHMHCRVEFPGGVRADVLVEQSATLHPAR